MNESEKERAPDTAPERHEPGERSTGVVIGLLVGFAEDGRPLVAFPGNPNEAAIEAKATTGLTTDDVGHDVALLFEEGDPKRPLVIGRIQKQRVPSADRTARSVEAKLDDESLVLSANRQIVLRCGEASIALTKEGKVLLRGTYILSHSKGANKVRGGSVHLN